MHLLVLSFSYQSLSTIQLLVNQAQHILCDTEADTVTPHNRMLGPLAAFIKLDAKHHTFNQTVIPFTTLSPQTKVTIGLSILIKRNHC
jgi:hypothetical protein